MLDPTDQQILAIIQENARTNNAEIARQVGMAPSAVLERVRKLEKRGVIQGYRARLNPSSLGFHLLAYIYVKTDESMSEMSTGEALSTIPEVQEVHHVAGEDCYLVKVRTESPESLGRLLRDAIGRVPTVLSTRSTIVLETIKEDFTLPLERSSHTFRGGLTEHCGRALRQDTSGPRGGLLWHRGAGGSREFRGPGRGPLARRARGPLGESVLGRRLGLLTARRTPRVPVDEHRGPDARGRWHLARGGCLPWRTHQF